MKTLDRRIASLEARKAKLERIISLEAEIFRLETRLLGGRTNQTKSALIVAGIVCANYKIPVSIISSRARPNYIVEPRHVIWYILRTVAGCTICSIGKVFQRDHAAIHHGIQSIHNRLGTEPKFAAEVNALAAAAAQSIAKPTMLAHARAAGMEKP